MLAGSCPVHSGSGVRSLAHLCTTLQHMLQAASGAGATVPLTCWCSTQREQRRWRRMPDSPPCQTCSSVVYRHTQGGAGAESHGGQSRRAPPTTQTLRHTPWPTGGREGQGRTFGLLPRGSGVYGRLTGVRRGGEPPKSGGGPSCEDTEVSAPREGACHTRCPRVRTTQAARRWRGAGARTGWEAL